MREFTKYAILTYTLMGITSLIAMAGPIQINRWIGSFLRWAGVFMLLVISARAATINVSPGGSIQGAINGASSGDTIAVPSGNYSGNVNVNKSGLTVKGTGFPRVNGFFDVNAPNCTVDGFAAGYSSVVNNRPFVALNSDHGTCSNCKLEHVTNQNVWDDATGFQLNGSYNTMLKCLTRDTDDLDAFRIFGDHNSIVSCEVYDKKNTHYGSGAHADSVQSWGGVSNGLVENCWFQQGRGQFAIIDKNPGGSDSNSHDFVWRNNIIIGSDQLFLFLRNMKLYNNVFFQCGRMLGDVIWMDTGSYSGYEMRNNAFIDCGTNAGNGFVAGGLPGNITCTNNAFNYGSNNGPVSHGVGSNAVNGGDPKFVSPGSDFHTQAGSVLSDKGVAISPAFLDRDGNQRTGTWDIGAYEGNAKPPEPSDTFQKGDKVTTLDAVNVRATPGGALLGTQAKSTTATVQESPASPAQFNGATVQWWSLKFSTDPSGWVGEDNLALSTATPTPSPSASPTPSPTVPPSPTPSPSPSSSYSNWLNDLGKWIDQHPAKPNL